MGHERISMEKLMQQLPCSGSQFTLCCSEISWCVSILGWKLTVAPSIPSVLLFYCPYQRELQHGCINKVHIAEPQDCILRQHANLFKDELLVDMFQAFNHF